MERKLLWKFNIIDLVLLGVIALSLIALCYKIIWGQDAKDSQTFLFTYICTSAPEEVYQGIVAGAECSDGEFGVSLGKLTNLTLSDIPEEPKQKQGVFITALNGEEGVHGVSVEDVLYLKGKECKLVVEDSVFLVYLSDIQKID